MITANLARLGLEIPTLAGAFGAYVPARRAGDLVYVAGQLPMKDGQLLARGAVPSAVPIEQARVAARQCVLNGLAAAKTVVPLDGLLGVVRVGAWVCSDVGFDQQPAIVNAASELLIELFGDPGRHARAAVGTNVLPLNASVEIEFLFQCG